MRRQACFAFLFAIAALCAISLLHAADSDLSIEGWGDIVNPDGDCAIAVNGEGVAFTLPGTAHDFAAELERWNAPRVMSDVRGDFSIEVKISGEFKPASESTIPGRTPYNGAGILLQQDEHNHVSLERAALFRNGEIRHYLNFELREDGQCTISRGGHNLDNQDTFLRLERRGDKIFAKSSQDRVSWFAYPAMKVKFPPKIRVGMVAVNSSSDALDVTFSELKLDRAPFHTTRPTSLPLAGNLPASDPTSLPSNVTTIQGIFEPDDDSSGKPTTRPQIATTQPAKTR
jgi:regulation of enolase protein 1 (concanavalin A-like superfamily)